MNAKLDDFVNRVKASKEKIREEANKLLTELLKEWFDKNPQVLEVMVQGYVPYFNDGDACVFHIRRIGFKLALTKEGDGEYEDGWLSSYDFADYDDPERETKRAPYHELESIINHLEDELNYQYGDHFELTITRDGIECDEYTDHD